ncbi:hypothetical protein, partial [Actinomadura physcomitrii]
SQTSEENPSNTIHPKTDRFASKKSPPPPRTRMATGRPGLPAGSIKALAFNTLLSSQETDTHRA